MLLHTRYEKYHKVHCDLLFFTLTQESVAHITSKQSWHFYVSYFLLAYVQEEWFKNMALFAVIKVHWPQNSADLCQNLI